LFGEISTRIHARFEGHLDRNHGLDDAVIRTVLID